jgi:hypothetical protein
VTGSTTGLAKEKVSGQRLMDFLIVFQLILCLAIISDLREAYQTGG